MVTSSLITSVWIVQRDSYRFNDNYVVSAFNDNCVVSAMVPDCFYLDEREAVLDAGYMNMKTLFESWWWFSPPKGSALSREFFNDEDEPDEHAAAPGDLMNSVYQMSLDDACLFFSDQNNIESLMEEAGHRLDAYTCLYIVCKLTLKGTELDEAAAS